MAILRKVLKLLAVSLLIFVLGCIACAAIVRVARRDVERKMPSFFGLQTAMRFSTSHVIAVEFQGLKGSSSATWTLFPWREVTVRE
jgi:Fe2+ transport system protein B